MGLDSVAPSSRNDEFQDLERHDLLTGEPRYVEDEIRNTRFAMIFGILGFLFALVSMILVWVLYHRDKNRTFLWHGIWMTILVVFFIIAIVWSLGAGSAVKTGRQPSNFLTFFVFIISLVFIGYLLVESVWLILFRKVHFDHLVGLSSNQNEFNDHVASGFSFNQAWKQHRRMIWWIVFFNLAAAITLAFIAYAARSVTWNRYVLARVTLYVALVFMVLAAWLMIYWVEEAYEYRKAIPGYFLGNLLGLIKAWAIIALCLAVANAFVNMLQSKVGYFIMAALEIALIIAMVMTVGIILREVRHKLFDDVITKGDCTATLYSINENELSDRWCATGGKYLDAGQTCRKQDLVNRWEGNNEIRTLNPGCCDTAKFYYLYPFMLVGFWTLVCIFATAVAVACNLYLADTNEYLSSANRSIGLIDFIGLAAVLIMLIAWGIYFIARKANSIQFAPNSGAASFSDPQNNRIAGFDLVPESIKSFSDDVPPTVNDGCFAFNNSGSAYPTFSTSAAEANCTNEAECFIRLAMLFKDSTIKINGGGEARQGSTTNRQLFFPECTGIQNDYLFYYGTESQLKILLNTLRICPRSTGAKTVTFFQFADQQNKSIIQNNGQLPAENAGPNVVNNADGANCGAGFTTSNLCRGSCKISRTLTETKTLVPLKGRMYYLQNGQRNYTLPSSVSVDTFFRNDKIGGTRTVYADGVFTVLDIPREVSNAYISTIDINDAAGIFLRKKVDVLIQPNSTGNNEISAGFIRLLTPNGRICPFTDTACINTQSRLTGNINIDIRDGSGDGLTAASPQLPDIDLNLIKYHQVGGQSVARENTGVDGRATFTNLPYESYTVIANKTGYKPVMSFLDLQEPNLNVKPFVLRPNVDQYDMRVLAEINEPNVDFDLNLIVKSDKGTQCTVSPTNKYCAYASHFNDVGISADGGEENILVKKLAVANYVAFLAPSPAYAGSCPQASSVDANRQAYHAQGWNWESFKLTKDLSELDINTFTFGRNVGIPDFLDFSGRAIGLLRVEESVESESEAKALHRVINRNGQPVGGNVLENTFFGEGSNRTELPPQTLVINGTISANNTTPFTIGDCNGTLNNVTYTNNTALGLVLYTQLVNLTTCTNGTNFTNNSLSSVFYGIDKTRFNAENTTYTIRYPNGSSIVRDFDNNFSFPNATFDLIRNQTNDSIIVGVNTSVTAVTPFAINVSNTNNTFTNTTLMIINPSSSNQANATSFNVTEIEYRNSVLINNYTQNFSTILTNNATGDLGTRNTSFVEIESFGTVNFTQLCNISRLQNSSTTLNCSQVNITTFTNGSVLNTTSSKNETDTVDINAGANIALESIVSRRALPSGLVVFNRTENSTDQTIPNGTNLTILTFNASGNSSGNISQDFSLIYDIDDLNLTNTSVTNNITYIMIPNGTTNNYSLFLNNSNLTNNSTLVIRNFSNTTLNGTNNSNTTDDQYRYVELTVNSTNITIVNLSQSFYALNSTNFSIKNFTNETIQSASNFTNVTANSSAHFYINGTNSTYNLTSRVANVANASNISEGNLTIAFNFSNNSSSAYNKSYNLSFIGTNFSDSKNFSGYTEKLIRINVSETNESFSDIVRGWKVPVFANNTDISVFSINNLSRNYSQNLSYANSTVVNFSNMIFFVQKALNTSANLSVLNEKNASYSSNSTNQSNVSWTSDLYSLITFNQTNITETNSSNKSHTLPNINTTLNSTNSSVINFSRTEVNSSFFVNISNLTTNLSVGNNATNATKTNSQNYSANHTNITANATNFSLVNTLNQTSPANGTNITFYLLTIYNSTNTSVSNDTNTCNYVNTTASNIAVCNFSNVTSNGTDINATFVNNTDFSNGTNLSNGTNISFIFRSNVSNFSNTSIANVTSSFANNSTVSLPSNDSAVNITNSTSVRVFFFSQSAAFLNTSNNLTINLSQGSNHTNATSTNSSNYSANLTNITANATNFSLVNTLNQTIINGDNTSNYLRIVFNSTSAGFNNDTNACKYSNTTDNRTVVCNFSNTTVIGSGATEVVVNNYTIINIVNFTNLTNLSTNFSANITNSTNNSVHNTSITFLNNSSINPPSNDSAVNRTNFTIIKTTFYNDASTIIVQSSNSSLNLSSGSNDTNATDLDSTLFILNTTNVTSGLANITRIEKKFFVYVPSSNIDNFTLINSAVDLNSLRLNASTIDVCTIVNGTTLNTRECNDTKFNSFGDNSSVATITNFTDFVNLTNRTNGTNTSLVINFTNTSDVNTTGARYDQVVSRRVANVSRLNTSLAVTDYLFNSLNVTTTAFNSSDPASNGTKWCNFTNTTEINFYVNASRVLLSTASNTCVLLNDSNTTVTTVTYINQGISSSCEFVLVNATTNIVGFINVTTYLDNTQTSNTVTNTSTNATRRRILMEEPIATKNIKPSHFQNQNGNFIFISCFTGFGTSSLVNINQITADQPTVESCVKRIAQEHPEHTLEKLRERYNQFIRNNPGAA